MDSKVRDNNARIDSKVLRLENIDAGYGAHPIASDINFDLEAGEIVSLIGPNGSGKTTILKTIAGFIPALSGSIFFDGRNQKDYGLNEKSRYMSVMMTERMSTDQMTVRDMISLGRFPYTDMLGRLSESDKDIVEKSIARVDLESISDKIYNDLSDGQKQRALLARAISQEPKLLLLDEPTSYLDIYHKMKFIDILRSLARDNNVGILMSVHELEIAFEISDRIVCLGSDGRIKALGKPKDVFSHGIVKELYNLNEGRLESMYGGFLDALSQKE